MDSFYFLQKDILSFRVLHRLSFRAYARNLSVLPNPMQTVWGISCFCPFRWRFFTSLRFVQNDTLVIPSEAVRPTRNLWLSIVWDSSVLRPLRQPSPYFYLLSRSRQPDKGGHFPTPTLPTIKGVGGSYLSFRVRPVARRGISSFLLVTLYSRLAEDSSRQSLSEWHCSVRGCITE